MVFGGPHRAISTGCLFLHPRVSKITPWAFLRTATGDKVGRGHGAPLVLARRAKQLVSWPSYELIQSLAFVVVADIWWTAKRSELRLPERFFSWFQNE